ncbi:MAG: CinA family protein [Kangiellaceae bacterium]|nr:CinA family protein [Kangiellaceae bacterium]
MQNDISKLSVRLLFKGIKLITVESCTGGALGKAITDSSGSSSWYEAGYITYSDHAKSLLVNVTSQTLDKYGAVSPEVADAMARGALANFPKCISVSATGVAGPDGGTKNKPVGTVCIACSYGEQMKVRKLYLEGNREQIRQDTVAEAIKLVLTMDILK